MSASPWSQISPAARRLAWLVLLVSLGLRLGLAAWTQADDPARFMAQDSGSYLGPAAAMLQTGRFDVSPGQPEPELVRTPGYPVFLAGLRVMFGQAALPVMVAQAVISTATLALALWLGLTLWGARGAVLGLVLAALDLGGLLFSQLILAECLFTFLLVLAVALGARLLSPGVRAARLEGEAARRVWPLALGVGLALALATLTRPVTVFLLWPLVILVGLGLWHGRGWKSAVGAVLIIALCWAGLVGGWQARNQVVSGSSALSHIVGHNLLKYWAAEVISMRDGIPRLEAEERLRAELGHPEKSGMPDAELQALYTAKTKEVMLANPVWVMKGAIKGVVAMLAVPMVPEMRAYLGLDAAEGPVGDLLRLPLGQWARRWVMERPGRLLANALVLAYLAVVYLGALLSIWWWLTGRSSAGWSLVLVWMVVGYVFAISIAPSAYPRLLAPIWPLAAALAGGGLARLRRGVGAEPDRLL